MIFRYFTLSLIFLFFVDGKAQKKHKYKIRSLAFYNVENLFDTINDPNTFDDDRTPNGKYLWNTATYTDKIQKIAHTISRIGQSIRKEPPDIIGLAEVENISVLNDLISSALLRSYNYGIIHKDSKDQRGIDVALLFKKEIFIPNQIKTHALFLINDEGYRLYTRDILVVNGYIDNELIYILVNHWPSRRGGILKSEPRRIAAALLHKRVTDSILKIDHDAKIISMGDFNDGPLDKSFKKILKTGKPIRKEDTIYWFNPMEKYIKKGIGSLAYKDSWNLFDQFLFTSNFLNSDTTSFFYWKSNVFNADFLIQSQGRYKGYPKRSYANGNYNGGYSDHFPIYMFLLKKAQ